MPSHNTCKISECPVMQTGCSSLLAESSKLVRQLEDRHNKLPLRKELDESGGISSSFCRSEFFSTVEGCLISGSHSEMTAAATTTAAGLSHQLTGNH